MTSIFTDEGGTSGVDMIERNIVCSFFRRVESLVVVLCEDAALVGWNVPHSGLSIAVTAIQALAVHRGCVSWSNVAVEMEATF